MGSLKIYVIVSVAIILGGPPLVADIDDSYRELSRYCQHEPTQPTEYGDLARAGFHKRCDTFNKERSVNHKLSEIEVVVEHFCIGSQCNRILFDGKEVRGRKAIAKSIRLDLTNTVEKAQALARAQNIPTMNLSAKDLSYDNPKLRKLFSESMQPSKYPKFTEGVIDSFFVCVNERVGSNSCEGSESCIKLCETNMY